MHVKFATYIMYRIREQSNLESLSGVWSSVAEFRVLEAGKFRKLSVRHNSERRMEVGEGGGEGSER